MSTVVDASTAVPPRDMDIELPVSRKVRIPGPTAAFISSDGCELVAAIVLECSAKEVEVCKRTTSFRLPAQKVHILHSQATRLYQT